jgi:ribonuclease HI
MELPQGIQQKGELGGLYILMMIPQFPLQASLGEATNNFNEFMAIIFLLILAKERGITQLNIYGDLMLVINCLNGKHNIHNYTLHALLDDIKRLLYLFSYFSFTHVYRIWNKEADHLSKDGLDLDQGY